MMLVYVCIMVFYLVYGIRQRKYVSFRAVLTLSGTCFAVIAMYILERVLHSNISFLAVGYLFGIALLIKYYERLSIYDMSANIMNSIEKMKEYGYLVVDDKKRCINANDYLKELFPEIRDWTVEKAAPMHDLGKIAIDDAVLRKPGKYTDAEYAEMKRHPAEGAKIVENILNGVEDESFVQIAKNIALYHHEKWNGKGYPTGLSGTDIPIEARIMALADVFDALVSKRCYKEAFSYDRAFAIIEESLGEHFDPQLGEVFLSCRAQLEALYDSWSDNSAVA